MGIKEIKTLINDLSVDKKITHFKGKKILVDASIYLYKFIYRAPNIEDSTRYVLDGFLQQLKTFKKYEIIPIYIFDGAATQHKKVLEERSKNREKLNSKAENAKKEVEKMEERLNVLSNDLGSLVNEEEIIMEEDECYDNYYNIPDITGNISGNIIIDVNDEEIQSNIQKRDSVIQLLKVQKRELSTQLLEKRDSIVRMEKQTRKPNAENVNATMRLLELLNVPYIKSPVESDALCAYLIRNGKVDAVFTEDTDMLPLRCTSFVCGFDKERAVLSEYHIETILKELEMTYEQFVDLCILCGCDYAGKINQIGPKRALPLIKKYVSIENLINEYIKSDEKLEEKHTFDDKFLEEVKQARIMFYTAHNIEDYIRKDKIDECLNFEWTIPKDIDIPFLQILTSTGMTNESKSRWLKAFKIDSTLLLKDVKKVDMKELFILNK